MRIDAAIGAVSQFDAHLYRLGETLALDIGGLAVLAQIFLGPTLFGADIVDIIAVVDIHY